MVKFDFIAKGTSYYAITGMKWRKFMTSIKSLQTYFWRALLTFYFLKKLILKIITPVVIRVVKVVNFSLKFSNFINHDRLLTKFVLTHLSNTSS